MNFVLFYHSLVSDWNHGNAHFLRGVIRSLHRRGHNVNVYEPRHGWSLQNLTKYHGVEALQAFHKAFPELNSTFYEEDDVDLDAILRDADVVVVHEWNTPALVAAIGAHHARRRSRYRLLFHDTHHRCASAPEQMKHYDLSHYDGVLAFGEVIRDMYLDHGWARRAWTWHEAADVAHYKPLSRTRSRDVVWIGNWGDCERTSELEEFWIEPVERLGLSATVCGVQYPPDAIARLEQAGIEYRGWASASDVVEQYASHRLTVHVPRRYYARALPGIPTIRVFEALACGVPLISAPWSDVEHLFSPGVDYLVARDGEEMASHMQRLLANPMQARDIALRGRRTILARHTCDHRVDELMRILESLSGNRATARGARQVTRVTGAA